METTVSLISGILSSLLAIFIIESYHLAKKLLYMRRLKKVLAFHGHQCQIVAPIYHKDVKSGLINHKDAYAFGHLFELCNRLNVDAKLVPFHKISDITEAEDLIIVGGPLSNKFTQDYLHKFCSGFQLVSKEEGCAFKELPVKQNVNIVTGFRCGEQIFLANEEEEYAILVKLTEKELEQERTIHLLFGYSGIGTGASSYFLWKYHGKLFKQFGKGKYFVAIKVSRHESYKSISSIFIDLTDKAFK